MEEKLNSTNVEIATISLDEQTKKPVYRLFEKTELDAILKDITF